MESNPGGGLGKLLPKGIRRKKRESREDMSASPSLAAAASDVSFNWQGFDDADSKHVPESEATIADGDDAGITNTSHDSEGES
jgi:hypothetical protein